MVKLSRYSSYMYLIKRSYSFMYEIRKIICNIMVEGVSLLFSYNNIYSYSLDNMNKILGSIMILIPLLDSKDMRCEKSMKSKTAYE